MAIGQTLEGVSKAGSGARREEENGGRGGFRRDSEGKPGGGVGRVKRVTDR